jgi:hypothetical protein
MSFDVANPKENVFGWVSNQESKVEIDLFQLNDPLVMKRDDIVSSSRMENFIVITA